MKYSLEKLRLSNSFITLGDAFFSRTAPTPFDSQCELVHYNQQAAALLDLDPDVTDNPQLVADIFSGKQLLLNSDPIAMLYAGHQFGHFVSQLGDGRAIIVGETTNQSGEQWELQLKGCGKTPYSRDGDGRAVLRSTIREYLCSESMHALGIPTTRALCIVGSDDEVYREQIETGAILTRLAPSHVRFGSFEVFYYRDQYEQIRTLADYMIAHHYPMLVGRPDCYVAWLDEVIDRTASLIAQWQAVGFCHGVMNTDNMSVLGLTIDYGPYAFMEGYEPGYICNHSDHDGRYAYNQQPNIGLFNLSCFAQAILPVLSNNVSDSVEQAVDIAKASLETYQARYISYYSNNMRAKLGLLQTYQEDEVLVSDLLDLMAADKVDFTILFRQLCSFSTQQDETNHVTRDLFIQREHFDQWASRYMRRLQKEEAEDQHRSSQMKCVNPKYILRNYMAENAIRQAEENKDYSEIERLMRLLRSPYDEQPEFEEYASHPPDWAKNISVSCSS